MDNQLIPSYPITLHILQMRLPGKRVLLGFLLGVFCSLAGFGQDKYYMASTGRASINSIAGNCTDCYLYIFGNWDIPVTGGYSFGPDSTLYVSSSSSGQSIYTVDTVNGETNLFFSSPPTANLPEMGGLVAMGNGIFYSIPRLWAGDDSLYVWDTNAGTVTSIGQLSYPPHGEMWLANGVMYYLGTDPGGVQIVQIDLSDPSNSQSIFAIPNSVEIFGLTATPVANIFLGATNLGHSFRSTIAIDIVDGTITELCSVQFKSTGQLRWFTSMFEHQYTSSENFIDLDCDDSSLATGSDFNAPMFDCFNEGGVPVADTDVVIRIDAILESIIFEIANTLDGDNEVFTIDGSTPGIIIDSDGTSTLTLLSEGGATVANFLDAIKKVRYDNLSLSPTEGIREIQVRITSESGNESNIARAFIQVTEHPQIEIDLGPDQYICEGSPLTLDATVFGSDYIWSTGETTESIVIENAGMYSVTLSSNIKCPNADTIEIFALPVINISLSGDTAICAGNNATLIITSDAQFLIDIEISSAGSPLVYSVPGGNFNFWDAPSNSTAYAITDINPSEPSCINLVDDHHYVIVHSSSIVNTSISLCEGDSVLIGNEWQQEPGIYPLILETNYGCDSLINYSLSIDPTQNIFIHEVTCDSSAIGVFHTTITNPDGCDTTVTRTVSLMPSDTTRLFQTTCRISEAGEQQEILSSHAGCDSIVITTLLWTPPADTTLQVQVTCDSSLFGITHQSMSGVDGCDSVVMIQVIAGEPVTTHHYLTSCDSSSLGTFEYHYVATNGCDSAVITMVTYSAQDSVFISSVSCDPMEVGVHVYIYTNGSGCDSIVIENISLSASNEIYLNSTTCDPASAGNFVYSFINQFGCDSIVHETTTLLPPSETFLHSTTCNLSDTGVFTNIFINHLGCDSIVMHTVSLLPPVTTEIFQKTCMPGEAGIVEHLFIAQDGCDSIVTVTTQLHPLPELVDIITSDYSGYGISCFGKSDGSIHPVINGVDPLEFLWSNGSTDPELYGLTSGEYSLTVTDDNGCQVFGSITLTETEEFTLAAEILTSDCESGDSDVMVTATGGNSPYHYSNDGIIFQDGPLFENLNASQYTLTALDANDCIAVTEIEVIDHAAIHVDLGKDITLSPGESISIGAIINVPLDSLASIEWIGQELEHCNLCMSRIVSPTGTMEYIVNIIGINGCVDSDTLIVFVGSSADIFIPNVFSPNGDNINDLLRVNSGPGIKMLLQFIIYDRWGGVVFSKENFATDDSGAFWDGTVNGSELNSGVFVYRVIAEMKNGTQINIVGDITLVK